MNIYNKVKWILGVLMIFILIIVTNLVDRNNFIRIKEAMETIYEDRLIANDLIFEFTRELQEKELAFATSDSTFFKYQNEKVNDNLLHIIKRYQETKLTTEEERVFVNLKANLGNLKSAEKVFTQKSIKNIVPKERIEIAMHHKNLKENLYDLAKIQLDEGGRQMSISKKAVSTMELFTQIEIGILIFLAIIIQIIIMYDPEKKKNKIQQSY